VQIYNVIYLEFFNWSHINRQLLPLILFTDVATFTRNSINDAHNSHQWSHDNLHGTLETNFQRCFFIYVWCDMIDDMFTGPTILDDCITRHNYLDYLQAGSPELLEDIPLATLIAMYLQHDGAPSHCTLLMMQHLTDTFPNQWISCDSSLTGHQGLQT
jgi:hypothetical protein